MVNGDVRRYRTVKLPSEMITAVEKLIKEHPEYGYTGLADFIKDAVRHHYVWYVHKIRFVREKSDLEYEIDPDDPNFSENVLIKLADPNIPEKEPFSYLYRDFKDTTTKMDYALVIGFSFRDPTINNAFMKMLDKNPDSKIIVVDPHASINIKENLCKDADKANELIKLKRLMPIEILFDEPKKVDMIRKDTQKVLSMV